MKTGGGGGGAAGRVWPAWVCPGPPPGSPRRSSGPLEAVLGPWISLLRPGHAPCRAAGQPSPQTPSSRRTATPPRSLPLLGIHASVHSLLQHACVYFTFQVEARLTSHEIHHLDRTARWHSEWPQGRATAISNSKPPSSPKGSPLPLPHQSPRTPWPGAFPARGSTQHVTFAWASLTVHPVFAVCPHGSRRHLHFTAAVAESHSGPVTQG